MKSDIHQPHHQHPSAFAISPLANVASSSNSPLKVPGTLLSDRPARSSQQTRQFTLQTDSQGDICVDSPESIQDKLFFEGQLDQDGDIIASSSSYTYTPSGEHVRVEKRNRAACCNTGICRRRPKRDIDGQSVEIFHDDEELESPISPGELNSERSLLQSALQSEVPVSGRGSHIQHLSHPELPPTYPTSDIDTARRHRRQSRRLRKQRHAEDRVRSSSRAMGDAIAVVSNVRRAESQPPAFISTESLLLMPTTGNPPLDSASCVPISSSSPITYDQYTQPVPLKAPDSATAMPQSQQMQPLALSPRTHTDPAQPLGLDRQSEAAASASLRVPPAAADVFGRQRPATSIRPENTFELVNQRQASASMIQTSTKSSTTTSQVLLPAATPSPTFPASQSPEIANQPYLVPTFPIAQATTATTLHQTVPILATTELSERVMIPPASSPLQQKVSHTSTSAIVTGSTRGDQRMRGLETIQAAAQIPGASTTSHTQTSMSQDSRQNPESSLTFLRSQVQQLEALLEASAEEEARMNLEIKLDELRREVAVLERQAITVTHTDYVISRPQAMTTIVRPGRPLDQSTTVAERSRAYSQPLMQQDVTVTVERRRDESCMPAIRSSRVLHQFECGERHEVETRQVHSTEEVMNVEKVDLCARFGAENVFTDEYGEYVVKRITVPKVEVQTKEIRTTERREKIVEKRVPRVEQSIRYVDKPFVQYVDVEKSVPQYVYTEVLKPVKQYVDRPVERIVHVPKIHEVVVEKVQEVPGQIIEMPKPYDVQRQVILPKYLDRKVPVVVAQSFWPMITEDEQAFLEVECFVYKFRLVHTDVYVPLIVERPLVFDKLAVEHREVMSHHVPDPQFNALVKSLNPNLQFNDAVDLFRFLHPEKLRGYQGSWLETDIGALPLGSGAGTEAVEMRENMQITTTQSAALLCRTIMPTRFVAEQTITTQHQQMRQTILHPAMTQSQYFPMPPQTNLARSLVDVILRESSSKEVSIDKNMMVPESSTSYNYGAAPPTSIIRPTTNGSPASPTQPISCPVPAFGGQFPNFSKNDCEYPAGENASDHTLSLDGKADMIDNKLSICVENAAMHSASPKSSDFGGDAASACSSSSFSPIKSRGPTLDSLIQSSAACSTADNSPLGTTTGHAQLQNLLQWVQECVGDDERAEILEIRAVSNGRKCSELLDKRDEEEICSQRRSQRRRKQPDFRRAATVSRNWVNRLDGW